MVGVLGEMTEDNFSRIRSNYDFLEKARNNEWNDEKSTQARSIAVYQLEQMMNTQFRNTQDFKKKMSDHFNAHPNTDNE